MNLLSPNETSVDVCKAMGLPSSACDWTKSLECASDLANMMAAEGWYFTLKMSPLRIKDADNNFMLDFTARFEHNDGRKVEHSITGTNNNAASLVDCRCFLEMHENGWIQE